MCGKCFILRQSKSANHVGRIRMTFQIWRLHCSCIAGYLWEVKFKQFYTNHHFSMRKKTVSQEKILCPVQKLDFEHFCFHLKYEDFLCCIGLWFSITLQNNSRNIIIKYGTIYGRFLHLPKFKYWKSVSSVWHIKCLPLSSSNNKKFKNN